MRAVLAALVAVAALLTPAGAQHCQCADGSANPGCDRNVCCRRMTGRDCTDGGAMSGAMSALGGMGAGSFENQVTLGLFNMAVTSFIQGMNSQPAYQDPQKEIQRQRILELERQQQAERDEARRRKFIEDRNELLGRLMGRRFMADLAFKSLGKGGPAKELEFKPLGRSAPRPEPARGPAEDELAARRRALEKLKGKPEEKWCRDRLPNLLCPARPTYEMGKLYEARVDAYHSARREWDAACGGPSAQPGYEDRDDCGKEPARPPQVARTRAQLPMGKNGRYLDPEKHGADITRPAFVDGAEGPIPVSAETQAAPAAPRPAGAPRPEAAPLPPTPEQDPGVAAGSEPEGTPTPPDPDADAPGVPSRPERPSTPTDPRVARTGRAQPRVHPSPPRYEAPTPGPRTSPDPAATRPMGPATPPPDAPRTGPFAGLPEPPSAPSLPARAARVRPSETPSFGSAGAGQVPPGEPPRIAMPAPEDPDDRRPDPQPSPRPGPGPEERPRKGPRVIGDPERYAKVFHRQTGGTCVLASIRQLLSDRGISKSEDELFKFALEQGLFTARKRCPPLTPQLADSWCMLQWDPVSGHCVHVDSAGQEVGEPKPEYCATARRIGGVLGPHVLKLFEALSKEKARFAHAVHLDAWRESHRGFAAYEWRRRKRGDTLPKLERELLQALKEGKSALLGTETQALWGVGEPHALHAIVVTAAIYDEDKDEIVGFFINDTGTGQQGRYLLRREFEEAWLRDNLLMAFYDR